MRDEFSGNPLDYRFELNCVICYLSAGLNWYELAYCNKYQNDGAEVNLDCGIVSKQNVIQFSN